MATNESVLFEEHVTAHGARIGIATLNAPQVLNSLSYEMVTGLAAQLTVWASDAQIVMVILRAAGDKAFCAGGDLHGLYAAARSAPRGDPWAQTGARSFFEHEYRLDYQIHTYPKPLLCWGHGIVMGGGMGLMMGASHRVVTETSKLAMPEISIGLFPDVGGRWILSRLPGRLGLFLALTGAQLGPADALYAALADVHIPNTQWPDVFDAILDAQWETGHLNTDDAVLDQPARGMNDATLTRILQSHAAPVGGDGPLARHTFLINNWCSGNDLEEIGELIGLQAEHEDPWLARAAQTYLRGAPGSARLAFALQQRARLMSLAEVFQMEFIAVLGTLAYGDIQEGIRALLIDKDKRPKWQPATLAEADDTWVQKFFEPPWPDGTTGPLADLGTPRTQANA